MRAGEEIVGSGEEEERGVEVRVESLDFHCVIRDR